MLPLDDYILKQLSDHLISIEGLLSVDMMSIIGPIVPGLENIVRRAVENFDDRKEILGIILDTNGGVVEVVERMVNAIRHHYKEVYFLVPNQAMSAGTIFVLSGDRIFMDYFSCLGPIDPQIEREGKLVPALSYLTQFERLNKKANEGELTTAEYALLTKLDLGDLYQFEQARELSNELIVKWLTQYKFKDWNLTETNQFQVTEEMKKIRALEIAQILNDTERWHAHGRGIDMNTLTSDEIKLKIEQFGSIDGLKQKVREYFNLAVDYCVRENRGIFVQTKEFF